MECLDMFGIVIPYNILDFRNWNTCGDYSTFTFYIENETLFVNILIKDLEFVSPESQGIRSEDVLEFIHFLEYQKIKVPKTPQKIVQIYSHEEVELILTLIMQQYCVFLS